MILPSSQSWIRRLLNSLSISLSLVILLTDSYANLPFWKQLIIVSVDISLEATCSQWIAFAMLTSCIISETFLPSSISETTCFSSLFLYLYLNALITPVSNGYNWEVIHSDRKINLMVLKLFWSVWGWQGVLSRKRMIFLRSGWTLQARSLSMFSIISVLCQAFSFEK